MTDCFLKTDMLKYIWAQPSRVLNSHLNDGLNKVQIVVYDPLG